MGINKNNFVSLCINFKYIKNGNLEKNKRL